MNRLSSGRRQWWRHVLILCSTNYEPASSLHFYRGIFVVNSGLCPWYSSANLPQPMVNPRIRGAAWSSKTWRKSAMNPACITYWRIHFPVNLRICDWLPQIDPNLNHDPFFHWVGFQCVFPWLKKFRGQRAVLWNPRIWNRCRRIFSEPMGYPVAEIREGRWPSMEW